MAEQLTPSDFANAYLDMPVYIYPPEENGPDNSMLAPPGWQRVRVANYRLGASAYRSLLWADISARMPAQSKVKIRTIYDVGVDETMSKAEIGFHFQQPFLGKGSPEQVQLVIQTLYRYHKGKTALQAFLAGDFIGLDCNGFVGNYYQRVIQGVRWRRQNNDLDPGPTTVINGLMEMTRQAGQITKLDDLVAGQMYILAECDSTTGVIADPVQGADNSYGHVMLTEPSTLRPMPGGKVRISVSEATADGARELRTNVDYVIWPGKKAPRGTVFRVERGAPGDTLDVRIARFKTS